MTENCKRENLPDASFSQQHDTDTASPSDSSSSSGKFPTLPQICRKKHTRNKPAGDPSEAIMRLQTDADRFAVFVLGLQRDEL
jgi:hypothetical protein